jgi:hypothetical protein
MLHDCLQLRTLEEAPPCIVLRQHGNLGAVGEAPLFDGQFEGSVENLCLPVDLGVMNVAGLLADIASELKRHSPTTFSTRAVGPSATSGRHGGVHV